MAVYSQRAAKSIVALLTPGGRTDCALDVGEAATGASNFPRWLAQPE